LDDFLDGVKEVKKEQMYLRVFSKKVATTKQKHMSLKKLVTDEANLDQRQLLSKQFIGEAIEP
jgi:hypothetical protein